MPTVNLSSLPDELAHFILHPDPLTEEDILIVDNAGTQIAAVISAAAYHFFLKKVEEAEDAIDSKIESTYEPHACTLEQAMQSAS